MKKILVCSVLFLLFAMEIGYSTNIVGITDVQSSLGVSSASISSDDLSVVGCLNVGSATECTTQGNVQASSALIAATIDTGSGAKEIGDTVANCGPTQVHKGDGNCEDESSLSVNYATNVDDVPTLDGLDSTAFELMDGSTQVESASNLAVGWYTIATNTGNRAIARFGLRDTASGRHQGVVFYASHHFGTDASNTITVLHESRRSIHPFRYIRIKDFGTYDGAALQVYIDDASNQVNAYLLGDNFQATGWVLKNWIPDATDPGDVTNYASFAERSRIDLDQIGNGGIATTGPIYAGGDTSQYEVWHSGNDQDGLDADTIDGISSGGFLRSNVGDTYTGSELTVDMVAGRQISSATSGLAPLELYQSTSGTDAFITFHVGGDYAAYFGLDGFWNDLVVGGWSKGANEYIVFHEENDQSYLDADTVDGYHANQELRQSSTSVRFSGQIELQEASPQIYYDDTTAGADDFWIHVNSNNFYVLADRDGDGSWETPHPLQLEADTNNAYVFGNTMWHSGNDQNGLDADTVDGLTSSQLVRADTSDTMGGSSYNFGTTTSTGGARLSLRGDTDGTWHSSGIALYADASGTDTVWTITHTGYNYQPYADTEHSLYFIYNNPSQVDRFQIRNEDESDIEGDGTFHSNGMDYAEYISPAEGTNVSEYEMGDIVVMANNKTVRKSVYGDTNYIGVVSTNPSFKGGPGDSVKDRFDGVFVLTGLVGQAPVKIIMFGEAIEVGDPIIASNLPGIGMKTTRDGFTVGRAMESTADWGERCPVVETMDDIEWPEDKGGNEHRPCFRIPGEHIDTEFNITGEEYVYVGKVMLYIDPEWWVSQETMEKENELQKRNDMLDAQIAALKDELQDLKSK